MKLRASTCKHMIHPPLQQMGLASLSCADRIRPPPAAIVCWPVCMWPGDALRRDEARGEGPPGDARGDGARRRICWRALACMSMSP
eukprot:CAMPEP_0174706576 /NCGR_PEP_ID=MMETSP1094-20130205/9372_1 /TAXON_ID=156173 /ORGANISM="Chrysochromulina brevifilum, Strain UTEX LB 985" /LENGTH=85 /DNA_ID=CAMNT_0015904851 /DNA_START=174 /DNA_END=431 /DNA_ORIENTATION=+